MKRLFNVVGTILAILGYLFIFWFLGPICILMIVGVFKHWVADWKGFAAAFVSAILWWVALDLLFGLGILF